MSCLPDGNEAISPPCVNGRRTTRAQFLRPPRHFRPSCAPKCPRTCSHLLTITTISRYLFGHRTPSPLWPRPDHTPEPRPAVLGRDSAQWRGRSLLSLCVPSLGDSPRPRSDATLRATCFCPCHGWPFPRVVVSILLLRLMGGAWLAWVYWL
jgi:hypothetical protein